MPLWPKIGERSMIQNLQKIVIQPVRRGQPGPSRQTTLTATVALAAVLALLPVHFD